MQHFKQEIKNAVSDAISHKQLSDTDIGHPVQLDNSDLVTPEFEYNTPHAEEWILPGNIEFVPGDKIERPPAINMRANPSCSKEGIGEDVFLFQLDQNEFLNLFFENLELPNLHRKTGGQLPKSKFKPAGTAKTGDPTRLDVQRTMIQSVARRKLLKKKLQAKINTLRETLHNTTAAETVKTLQHELEQLIEKQANLPFLQDTDLRFRLHDKVELPHTQAVIFCLMDVSGSMDEKKKDLAKRFYVLLYLFLKRHYQTTEVVFIRHHTIAKEVSEDDFFYSRETGGTVASTALELMQHTIASRYPPEEWNIYAIQASDGDNWNADSPYCEQLLLNHLLPVVQYYTYIEIMPRHHQSLWQAYTRVAQSAPHFAMRQVNHAHEIYPTFSALFKKRTGE